MTGPNESQFPHIASPASRNRSARLADPNHAETFEDLAGFLEIKARRLVVVHHHEQVVGEHRGVVPVETAVEHDVLVDDALFGVDGRIGHGAVVDALDERDGQVGLLQPAHGGQQGPLQFLLHGALPGGIARPGEMAVEDEAGKRSADEFYKISHCCPV